MVIGLILAMTFGLLGLTLIVLAGLIRRRRDQDSKAIQQNAIRGINGIGYLAGSGIIGWGTATSSSLPLLLLPLVFVAVRFLEHRASLDA